MSKLRKRDYNQLKKRNPSRQLNQRADVFKDKKREPKGGRHGEKVDLEQELELEFIEDELDG